jgi:hypothetical protein
MDSVARRGAVLNPSVETSKSPGETVAAAGVGLLAGGGTYYLLSKAGVPSGLAALGGAALGWLGIFAVVARPRFWDDPPSEETSSDLAETMPAGTEGSVLAAFVAEHLGLDLAAYVTGVDEKLVGRWIQGEVEPEPLPLGRLRAAYEATRLIVNRYDGETAQSWFSGMNPWLDDDAPGYVLRHGDEPESWESVVEASQDFVEFAR